MKNKILILFIITILNSNLSIAQTTTNYEHCNCKEIINYSENNSAIKNGEYLLKCNNSIVEKGLYKNGNKDGIWIVKNQNGKTVSRIEFTNGKLDGSYELFNFDGNPKLKAQFNDDKPEGEWIYSNKKERF